MSKEKTGLTVDDLHPGDEVYFSDPDPSYDDDRSGYYTVEKCVGSDVVVLCDGPEPRLEAFIWELS